MRPHNRKMKEFVAVLKREWWRRETHRLIIQSMRFMFPELDVLWSTSGRRYMQERSSQR
jgi:hypothetical protein